MVGMMRPWQHPKESKILGFFRVPTRCYDGMGKALEAVLSKRRDCAASVLYGARLWRGAFDAGQGVSVYAGCCVVGVGTGYRIYGA